MLVAVVSAAGVLALWLLPTILGCGALSIAYYADLCPPRFRWNFWHFGLQ